MLKFKDLREVPFTFYACNEDCSKVLKEKMACKQAILRDEIDREYERNMEEAMKEVPMDPNLVIPVPGHRRNRRRNYKCSIM